MLSIRVWKVIGLAASRDSAHSRLDGERNGLRPKQDERADNGPEERLARDGKLGRLATRRHEEESHVDEHEDDDDSPDADDKRENLEHQSLEVRGTKWVEEATPCASATYRLAYSRITSLGARTRSEEHT